MSLDVESIPGYKAILKAVIRSQIQLLLDQLCDQGGEESFILMACSGDGVLSQLGSRTGKGFMEGREEIKSQFMGHCLKSQHKKSTESRASPYQRPETSSPHKRMGPASKTLSKHQKVAPSPPTLASYAQDSSHSLDNSLTNDSCAGEDESNQSQDNEMTSTCKTNFPLSLNLNHTQTLASAGAEVHYRTKLSDKPESMDNDASIKIEPISDHTDSGQETVDATTSDLAVSDPWTTQQMSSAPSHTEPAVLGSGKFNAKENQGQEDFHRRQNLSASPLANKNTGHRVQHVEWSSANQNTSESLRTNHNSTFTIPACTSSIPQVMLQKASSENSANINLVDQSDVITVEITPEQTLQLSDRKVDSPVDQIDLTADDDESEGGNPANNHLVEVNSNREACYLSGLINQPMDPACNFSIVNVSSLSTQESFMYADSNAPGPSRARDDNVCDERSLYLPNHNAAVMSHFNTINDTGTLYIRPVDDTGASYSGSWATASTSVAQATNQISPVLDYRSDQEITIQETYADPTLHLPESIPINPYQAVKFNKEFYGRSKDRILLKKHICEVCGKRCLKKCDLERHLATHTGNKPFRCGVCGSSYNQRSNLLQHKKQYRH
ncbi:hypothetical protein DPMN_037519 [Dreissena polymorpha]|uniref:C2H2-type domain-containing protein n=1 Tax=Dreissena polymorpha TaxID=45954 RepID=A0A9D4RPX6_DREPO|nr:hypothetical protein DPMN_037519 [Dreissena polymorpha]